MPKAPSQPPETKPDERFTLTVSCPTAAVVAIAAAIVTGLMIANGLDPVAFLEAFIKLKP
ncbi:hypothetical protein ACSDR0_45910 [Streptosporangium sp. G11]|uniref:hypothetical protein n=1 Tax=Streptosporangium sp. G11 TaxID=3436926 RepID=UPI003EBA539A